jgi:hypothetical protein
MAAYPDDPRDANGEALEQRVRRLEDAVAAIQDTQLMEDRVVERVVHRVEHFANPQGSGLIVSAARMLMPKTVEAVPGNGAAPPAADGPAPTTEPQSTWLVVGVLQQLRWMMRMFTDYRYRMSWNTHVVIVSMIVVCVLSWLVLSGLPLVGGILDRVVLILAVIVAYQSLSREVAKYQELIARLRRRI